MLGVLPWLERDVLTTRMARSWIDDAVLSTISFQPVMSDGRADVSLSCSERCYYMFRSPSRSKLPDGVPRNVEMRESAGCSSASSPRGSPPRRSTRLNVNRRSASAALHVRPDLILSNCRGFLVENNLRAQRTKLRQKLRRMT
jgi:hypothetical protein